MRLITRSDFDGFSCAVLLVEKGIINDFLFVHPKDIQDGQIEITKNDVLANVPFIETCGLWFDHHISEDDLKKLETLKFEGDCRPAPSAAKVVWDYYGGLDTFGEHFIPLIDAVNKTDSADLTLMEILTPEEWILLSFVIDPKTGIAKCKKFKKENDQFIIELIEQCRAKSINEILKLPDVKERTDEYFEQQIHFKNMLRRCCWSDRNVVITNLLEEEKIYCGNRFIVFASHPDQNVEIRITKAKKEELVEISCGYSILNKTCQTDIGNLMSKYGGGGHHQVGACRVPKDKWKQPFEEILDVLKRELKIPH